MEHGHDRENGVIAAKVQLVGKRNGQGMQSDRPVRIEDSFGTAGSSRGVAQGRCISSSISISFSSPRRFRQKILIRFTTLREPAAAVIDDKDAFKVDSMPYLLEKVEQHILHNQKAVLGVIDDVSEFVRMQPRLRVCSTAPVRGTPNSSRWAWPFHMRVAMRSPLATPAPQEQPLIVWSAGADLDRCSYGAHRQAAWKRLRLREKGARPLQHAVDESGEGIMVDFMKPPWFEEEPAEAVDHQTTVIGRKQLVSLSGH